MRLNEDARALLDSMGLPVVVIDSDTRIVYANTAYRDFIARCPGSPGNTTLEGRPLRNIHPQSRLPEVLYGDEGGISIIRGEREAPYAAARYPITQFGEITGGVAAVLPLEDAALVRRELDTLAREQQRIRASVARVTRPGLTFRELAGEGVGSRQSKALARKAAECSLPLLLEGPNGTGKGFYARVIHACGRQKSGIFAEIDCAALDRDALDRTLFGVGDSDTGEDYEMGLLEAASGGTLYLRAIDRMSLPLQQRLLNAIKNRRFCPPGSRREVPMGVRLIAGTTIPAEKLDRSERFHSELLHTLSALRIVLPPLRERPEDIPVLSQLIMRGISTDRQHKITVSLGALQRLVEYEWPGNVAELRAVLEYAVCHATGPTLRPEHLPEHIGIEAPALEPLCVRTRRFEQEEIRRALRLYGTSLPGKKQAAAALGISLASLYNKMRDTSAADSTPAPEEEP